MGSGTPSQHTRKSQSSSDDLDIVVNIKEEKRLMKRKALGYPCCIECNEPLPKSRWGHKRCSFCEGLDRKYGLYPAIYPREDETHAQNESQG